MDPSSELSSQREKLLALDKKKKDIETEIMSLTQSLNSPGMPGISYIMLFCIKASMDL